MLSFASTAIERPTASRTARTKRGAEERAQQVAVAEVQLDGVEAGVLEDAGSRDEVARDARDVALGRGRGEAHRHRAEDARRRQAGASGAGRNRTCVPDLRRDGCALGVHGVGQLAQPGRGFGAHDDLSGRALAVLRDGEIGHCSHAQPAGGHHPVKVDQPVADQVALGHPLERGCLDEAVAQANGAEVGGSKRVDRHVGLRAADRITRTG
jgi:hypothetical protein